MDDLEKVEAVLEWAYEDESDFDPEFVEDLQVQLEERGWKSGVGLPRDKRRRWTI